MKRIAQIDTGTLNETALALEYLIEDVSYDLKNSGIFELVKAMQKDDLESIKSSYEDVAPVQTKLLTDLTKFSKLSSDVIKRVLLEAKKIVDESARLEQEE